MRGEIDSKNLRKKKISNSWVGAKIQKDDNYFDFRAFSTEKSLNFSDLKKTKVTGHDEDRNYISYELCSLELHPLRFFCRPGSNR